MHHVGRRRISVIRSKIVLSLLLLSALNAHGEHQSGSSARDVRTQQRRQIKKKSPKHFALDTLVDGFDDQDDTYYVSYNEKKNGPKSTKKKCKGKSGKSSTSKKKKKGKKESSWSSSDDDDSDDGSDDCTAYPTMLVTDAPTIAPTIEPTKTPTVSPTMQPTTLSPTLQPTVTRTDEPTLEDEDSESSSKKGKKSKKEKSKKEKSKVRDSTAPNDTSKGSVRTSKVKADAVKGKVVPKFRAEIPISIPFPSNAPLQTPSTAIPNSMGAPSPVLVSSATPSPKISLGPTEKFAPSGTTPSYLPTTAPSITQSALPTASTYPLESETRAHATEQPTQTHQDHLSTTLVEASAFYIAFMLDATVLDPTHADLREALAVCTTFLETYVHATFLLIDASNFVQVMTAPFSFSPDFTSTELVVAMEFEDSSEFIPSTDDIDMLLEIAFTEPSVGTLLDLLAVLPNDNPFRHTTSVTRIVGSLQLELSSNLPQPATMSSSTSSNRSTVVGAFAAAFVVVAFAALYRNRHQYRKRRKFSRRTIEHHDIMADTNESSIGAPTMMEQLVEDDDSDEVNTIEFFRDDEEETVSSHHGSLFDSPFMHGELSRSFNEV